MLRVYGTMRRFVLRFGPILLAFILGFLAHIIWIRRREIIDVWNNLFLYYED